MSNPEEFQPGIESEEALFARLHDIWSKKMQAINALAQTDPDAFDVASEKIPDFSESLKKKYLEVDLRTYKLYHLLIGSGLDKPEDAPHFDLPEKDIQNFIENKL